MTSSVSLECKKLCVRRCFYAVLYSVAGQFMLLTTFLLFVNFSVLHPFDWLYSTVDAIFSWRTWLSLVPLLAAVVAHGILLGKAQLAERRFHPNRFTTITRTAAPQASLFAMHMAIGLLTAWLYARYLPVAYANPFGDCDTEGIGAHRYCLNDSYVLLLLAGCHTSMYYFVRERVRRPVVFVQFPLVQQARYLEMRTNVHAILVDSLRAAVLPTVAFAVAGYLLGDVFVSNIALICGMGRNNATMSLGQLFDPALLWWMFVISAQIISNMRLVDHLFNTFLTEHMQFPIERPTSAHLADGYGHVVTLCDALAATATPLVQELAALDLASLCAQTAAAAQRRQQVFALSVPGNHPHTWKALSTQCLALIDGFRVELQTNVERALAADGCVPGVAYLKGPAAFGVNSARPPMAASSLASDSASDLAAKLMTRQHNETYGIRSMQARSPGQQQLDGKPSDPCRKFNETIERLQHMWQQFKLAIMRLPGIHFLFGVDETARLTHQLAVSCQPIGHTVHGLASLAVHSLKEDTYGVVQTHLARIIGALLRLRIELEKVNSVPFGAAYEHARPQLRAAGLRGTVKRSLTHLAQTFSEYLPELLKDARELRTMESFAQSRET